MIKRVACFVLLFLAPAYWRTALGQDAPLVIEGGTLIDGTGRPPLADALIVIEGNRIRDIGQSGRLQYPPGAKVIDAKGKFILPGLIDCHVHYKGWDPELYLAHGVTTVVDIGNLTEWIMAQRDGIAKGKIIGPRMLASGNPIRGPFPEETDFQRWHHTVVRSTEEAREEAKRRIAQGANVIKVYDGLTTEMLKAIIEEARRAGIPVVGHTENAWEAIEVGYNGIVHTPGIALATIIGDAEKQRLVKQGVDPHALIDFQKLDRLIESLVAKRIYINPTLRAAWNWAHKEKFQHEDFELLFNNLDLRYIPLDYRLGILKEYNQVGLYWFRDLSPQQKEIKLRAYKNAVEFLRRFAKAGGKICTGSDTMSTGGLSLHQEMQLMVEEVGLTPYQAIMTVTKNSAELMRIDDRLGSVEKGKLADLVIVRGNPLENIRNARNIEMVFKDGKLLDTSYHPEFTNPIPKSVPEDTSHIFPSPVLKRIWPRVATEGEREATLTLSGTGFIPYSIAEFNGVRVPTKFVNRFELTVKVPAHLLEKAGTYPVRVINPRPVGTVFAPGHSDIIHFGLRDDTSNPLYFIVRFK